MKRTDTDGCTPHFGFIVLNRELASHTELVQLQSISVEPQLTAAKVQVRGKMDVFRSYCRFCLVGATGVVVDMCVLFLLADETMLGWNLSLAKVLAAETAIINNFLWNELWTFRSRIEPTAAFRALLLRLGRFNLICLSGIAISVGLLNFQVRVLNANPYVANLIAIAIVSLWNFYLSSKFGWKPRSS